MHIKDDYTPEKKISKSERAGEKIRRDEAKARRIANLLAAGKPENYQDKITYLLSCSDDSCCAFCGESFEDVDQRIVVEEPNHKFFKQIIHLGCFVSNYD
jgi:hypothetical protein